MLEPGARAILAVTVLIATVLGSGCLAPEACSVAVEPPKPGTTVSYEGSGRLETPSQNYAIIDWGIFQGGGSQELVVMPEGSSLKVQVSEAQDATMGLEGTFHPTWQVDYTVSMPGRPAVRFASEWVDASDGHLVAEAMLAMRQAEDGGPIHVMQLGRVHRPVAFAASPLWGETLREGKSWNFQLPMPLFFPIQGNYTPGEISFAVTKTFIDAGRCEAQVDMTYTIPELPGTWSYQYTMAEGNPFPQTIREIAVGSRPPLHLDLGGLVVGGGESISLWSQPPPFNDPSWSRTEQLQAQRDGFLAGGERVFPTSYAQAMAALRADAAAGQWLRENPDAVPNRVRHVLGNPGENIVDQWQINFVNPDGLGRTLTVQRERPMIALIGQETLSVSMETTSDPGEELPRLAESVITVDELARIHQQFYGKPVEVLDCFLPLAQCAVGRHDSMQMGYAGKSSLSLAGLTVDVNRGWVLQEESADPSAVQ